MNIVQELEAVVKEAIEALTQEGIPRQALIGRQLAVYGTRLHRLVEEELKNKFRGRKFEVYVEAPLCRIVQNSGARGRPDLVIIDHSDRIVVVWDLTSRERGGHVKKTLNYAQEIANALPYREVDLEIIPGQRVRVGYYCYVGETYWREFF